MSDPPESLVLFQLLRELPGYTADDLLAEDPDLIEHFRMYLNAEAIERKRQEQLAKRKR